MPGLLAMEQPQSTISSNLHKDAGAIQYADSPASPVSQTVHTNGSNAANGANGANGILRNTAEHSATDAAVLSSNGEFSDGRSGAVLPSLDDSWRISPANVSFGKMLERMAEGCYADFGELVTKLGDMPVSKIEAQSNGPNLGSKEDTDPASLKKKRLLLDFCSTWRERFIKALVISNWARSQGEDVAKIIDLRNTLRDRDVKYQQCIDAVFQLKVDAVGLRQPAPNIKGAIQYLSLGKSAYPDLGYIKPAPLRAEQILELTNEMGVQANLRIWLNEPELPFYMSEYTIANGRVSWKTKGEFEIDLACVDQDPDKSPWYFVDLRFLFSPASPISDNARPHLEAHINAALASKGLQGCYDFLHNYVLDSRISELEYQAQALLKGRWFETLRLERLRRGLTIQYWIGRGDKKSWIEFNVHSGNGMTPAHRPQTSANICRWFMDGKLVENVDLDIDWINLDLEKVLLDVQRRHTTPLLEALEQGLKAQRPAAQLLTIQLDTDDANAYNQGLILGLPSSHTGCTQELKVGIAPLTGRWYITPLSAQAKALRDTIDKDPDALTWSLLERLVCNIMHEGIEYEAHCRSWEKTLTLLPESQRNFRDLFHDGVQVSVWRGIDRAKKWPEDWAIAYSSCLRSARWWVVRLVASGERAQLVSQAYELFFAEKEWNQRLQQVEELARQQIQLITLASQKSSSISYFTEKAPTSAKQSSIGGHFHYFIELKDLMRGSRLCADDHTSPWAPKFVRVTRGRRRGSSWPVKQYLRLSIRPGRLIYLRQYLHGNSIHGIAINNSNGLAAQFDSASDAALFEQTRTTLQNIARLDQILGVTGRLDLQCTSVTLEQLVLAYGKHGLSAELSFSDTASSPIRLKLLATDLNPHQRIRASLEQVLNQYGDRSFGVFASILLFTLPLLTTAARLEAVRDGSPTCYLHERNATWYTLRYIGSPSIAFTIRARTRVEGSKKVVKWHLEVEQQRDSNAALPDDFLKALKDLWNNPGPGCQALKSGLTADAGSIANAMDKLHEVVKRFVVPVVPAQMTPKPEPAPQEQQQQQQSQQVAEDSKTDIIMLD